MSDAAIANIVTGLVTITTVVIGFLTLWVKLRYGVEHKIDTNTELTKAGVKASAVAAKEAANAAIATAEKTDAIAEKLNGKLEEKILSLVKLHTESIVVMIKSHIEQDDKNMIEIRKALDELRDRIRN